MPTRLIVASVASLVSVSLLAPAVRSASDAPRRAVIESQSDLDDFMARVLENRDENWKKIQQYVLDEREMVSVRGPSRIPIFGERHEYTWFIRDGFFVRSPLKANGVTVSEEERREYEDKYLRQAKARDRRDREREAEDAAAARGADQPADQAAVDAVEEPADSENLLVQSQPRFIDSAYFLEFKFEQGRYALVGRERYEDREVLRIEYYPEDLFSDDDDRNRRRRRNPDTEVEQTIERLINKVSFVTLWVDPAALQIVKYTFDNVNFDFLPAAWLVRVNDVRASMTMSQPFPDVWLPRDVEMYFSAMLAIGSFTVDYQLDYYDYREATTSGRIVGIGRGRGGGPGGGR